MFITCPEGAIGGAAGCDFASGGISADATGPARTPTGGADGAEHSRSSPKGHCQAGIFSFHRQKPDAAP